MSINALLAARTKLMADPAITAFFVNRYGKPAHHFVGYKKVQNANDYPSLCYVPVSSLEPDTLGGYTREQVSLVIGINEPGMTDDMFDGVVQLALIEALVLACLNSGQLGANAAYLGQARTTADLGARHPFHELEIALPLAAR